MCAHKSVFDLKTTHSLPVFHCKMFLCDPTKCACHFSMILNREGVYDDCLNVKTQSDTCPYASSSTHGGRVPAIPCYLKMR